MTTNYTGTFIRAAADCPAPQAEVPPRRAGAPTVAELQYELLSTAPYSCTSDDLIFAVHVLRHGLPNDALERERAQFFARPQPCLRSSPLAKRYGWGFHHDAEGRVALVPMGSDRYRSLSEDASLTQLEAMRSKRA